MKKQLLKKFVTSLVGAGVGLALLAAPAFADARTSTVWSVTSQDGVNVIPYSIAPMGSPYHGLIVDFDHFTPDMDYVYYNLNYTIKSTGVLGGIEGSFTTVPPVYYASFGGFSYVRRRLDFGTCSGQACVYTQPKSVTLKVNTHYAGGKIAQVTKVLSLPDNQF